jgi:hypothetical protein
MERKEVKITGSLDVTTYSSVDEYQCFEESAAFICRIVGTYLAKHGNPSLKPVFVLLASIRGLEDDLQFKDEA